MVINASMDIIMGGYFDSAFLKASVQEIDGIYLIFPHQSTCCTFQKSYYIINAIYLETLKQEIRFL